MIKNPSLILISVILTAILRVARAVIRFDRPGQIVGGLCRLAARSFDKNGESALPYDIVIP